MKDDGPWGRADLMATAAFRYCLGRSSYIVGDCVDWLIANWGNFAPATRDLIRRELNEAIREDDEQRWSKAQHSRLGWDMDRERWMYARQQIDAADARAALVTKSETK
jgi:hypothetical protein